MDLAKLEIRFGRARGAESVNIEELVIADSGQKFKGNDFRDLRKPGVYVFMLEGKALYVGMANMLLRRVGGWHKQAEQAIAECDEVLLHPCRSVGAALKLETLLISGLKPKCNRYQRKEAIVSERLGIKSFKVVSASPCDSVIQCA